MVERPVTSMAVLHPLVKDGLPVHGEDLQEPYRSVHFLLATDESLLVRREDHQLLLDACSASLCDAGDSRRSARRDHVTMSPARHRTGWQGQSRAGAPKALHYSYNRTKSSKRRLMTK